MTKKALSILVIACFYHFVLFAENVASFSIPTTYLESGKVRLNATGSTSFKFTVTCLRGLVNGTNDYEPANIVVNLVAYHAGSNGAPVMTIIGGPYTIKTADFGTTNIVTKTLDAVATYTNIQNETGITLVWASNANPNNNVWTSDYKFVPYTPVVPISNNTIAFNSPYVYMENVDITGSTPVVSTGTYTCIWTVNGITVLDPDFNPITNTVNNLLLTPTLKLVYVTNIIRRKIIDANGVENLSNELTLTRPASSITLNVVEQPGNTKSGDNFVKGTLCNLTVGNATPGVKYMWFYNHSYLPVNYAYTQLASGTGLPISFTISPTKFPPTAAPSAWPETVGVWGSDGSTGFLGFRII